MTPRSPFSALSQGRDAFQSRISNELEELEAQGLLKPERVLASPQGPRIRVEGRDGLLEVVNLCANNYLGLASHPAVLEAATIATAQWGAGLASVRFICGTNRLHKDLEESLARYLGYEDSILFPAAFDANGGLFETLLGPEDAVVSDALNHASIIDGVRLSKARRFRFANRDLNELELRLKEARAAGARTILIATDGVFSMDGYLADLAGMSALAARYGALLMVDDCHATGFVGPAGRGTPVHAGVHPVDILTGTFGKALGGAMGGFVAAAKPVVDLLRQRSRPYLFSNALSPSICGAAMAAIEIAGGEDGDLLRQRLGENAVALRQGLQGLGFSLLPGAHPIAPVMLGDARLAQQMAAALLDEGLLATGFSFPVVPLGQARIRTQVSAAHSHDDIAQALTAFANAGRRLGVIP
ncbi:glycine C-acetyltransferase [Phenylobacterium sp.]|uniref:glycine C-acetyltransferase n=1 Tax=Phenylobacterium sp. TaxID=1871053 RepID=UPI002FCB8CB3